MLEEITLEQKVVLARVNPTQLARLQKQALSYQGKWHDYEGYMQAGIMHRTDREGILLVRFNANTGIDKLGLHTHPDSKREIVILEGSGVFHYQQGGKVETVTVSVGSYVGFEKGLVHTFTTEQDSMLALSIHRPFIEFNDPRCLERNYDKRRT